MLTGFDHFIVLVKDLEAATQTFRRLGFDPRAGGAHPAFGSHNALIALADGAYIECVAFSDAALAAKSFWRAGVERLRVSEGFGGYVLASDDLARDVAQLRQRSLNFDEPQAGSRVRPDGQRVAWHTALFGGSPVGALPFLIQDDTPREWRIEPPREGMGSRARVQQVVVAVRDLDQARDQYRTLLGVEPQRVRNTKNDVLGYQIGMDWGSIVLAHPQKNDNAMADQLSQRGEGLYALTLQVEGLGRDRLRLRDEGIVGKTDGAGFLIAPACACGARIRLV